MAASDRTDALEACLERPVIARNSRLQPKTAFSRFPPVHSADLEGQQRVDLTRSTSFGERPVFARNCRSRSPAQHRSHSSLLRVEQPFFLEQVACSAGADQRGDDEEPKLRDAFRV